MKSNKSNVAPDINDAVRQDLVWTPNHCHNLGPVSDNIPTQTQLLTDSLELDTKLG